MSTRCGISGVAHVALVTTSAMIATIAMIAICATRAPAQEPEPGDGPRFLAMPTPSATPVQIDADDVPVLRRRITVRLADASLEDALREVAWRSTLSLVYSADVVPLDRRVSLVAADIRVSSALTWLLSGTGTDVLITPDGHAALVRRPGAPRASTGVAGRVFDASTGHGIAGATVTVDDTVMRTHTDERGAYHFGVLAPGPHTIAARHIGYAPQSRRVRAEHSGGSALDITMVANPDVLERVIVAGTMIPSTMKESPVPVAVFDEDRLAAPWRQRIDRLFRGNVPGVVAYDNGAFALGALSFVRGSGSLDDENLLKVYVDGVEAPSSALISGIDLTDVDHAELLRGPQGSTLYGSNASGGVLLLFTKRGRRGPPRLSGTVAGGVIASDYVTSTPLLMEHRLTLSGAGETIDYSLGGAYDVSGQVVPRGDRSQTAIHGRVGYTAGPIAIALTGALHREVIGASTVPALRDVDTSPVVPGIGAHYRLDDQFAAATLTYTPSSRWQHHLTVGQHGIGLPSYVARQRFVGDTPGDAVRERDEVASARYVAAFAWTPVRRISSSTTAGIEYARRIRAHRTRAGFSAFEPSGLPTDTATKSGGAFVQHVLGVDERLFLTAGARAERNSDIGSDHGAVWVPRVGAVYAFRAGPDIVLRPRVAYGRSIRAPQPGQAAASAIQRANPELRPETQRGEEIGLDLDYGHGAMSAEATYFDQRATDLIGVTRLGEPFDPTRGDTTVVPYLQNRNVGRVRNRGVELAASVAAGPLTVSGTFSTVRSIVERLADGYIGDQRVGDDMLYVARRAGGGSGVLRIRPLVPNAQHRPAELSAELTYVGSRRSIDLLGMYRCEVTQGPCADSERGYRISLPPFTKLRVGAMHPIARDVDAFVDVDNLTNVQRGELLAVVPSRGRTLLVGARFDR